MDEYEELREKVRRLAEHFQAMHQRQAIAEMEAGLEAVAVYQWPPTPGSAHPYYEDHAEQFRRLMRDGRHTIATVKPEPIKWWTDGAPVTHSLDIVHLYVKKAHGPAPYVGRPFSYVWRVAVDGHNRWVADEAERVWH